MRIAMLAPISWRTPPRHYGPWELVTSLLTEALVARGLDVTPEMIRRLERVGDPDSAAILDRIYRDEIGHVAVGVRWFKRLCGARGLDPEAAFHDRVRRYFTGALKPPFNRGARDAAGFPANWYERLANDAT